MELENVDLTKLSKQYYNPRELIMSTKDNKHLWFLFDTPGSENEQSNITAKMYSENQMKNYVSRANEKNLKKEKEEDFLGSLIGGINDMKIAKASGKIYYFYVYRRGE